MKGLESCVRPTREEGAAAKRVDKFIDYPRIGKALTIIQREDGHLADRINRDNSLIWHYRGYQPRIDLLD